jgi:hypothetical protein
VVPGLIPGNIDIGGHLSEDIDFREVDLAQKVFDVYEMERSPCGSFMHFDLRHESNVWQVLGKVKCMPFTAFSASDPIHGFP